MSAISCCKNCTDRTIGCHAVCERYISEAARHEAVKAAIRQANFEQGIAIEHFTRVGKAGKQIEKRRRGY